MDRGSLAQHMNYKNEGIILEPQVRELQKVQAETRFLDFGHRRNKTDVELELIQKLSSQLIKDGFIKFEEQHHSSGFGELSLRASILCVKSSKLTHFKINEEVFKYNNQNWSEEDIKIALKETFPERFI